MQIINENSPEFQAAISLTFMANKYFDIKQIPKKNLTICKHNNNRNQALKNHNDTSNIYRKIYYKTKKR